jgi:hypothetical protein
VSLTDKIKQTVRERAGFACEFCGVTEQSAGGELTIDHFKPRSANGTDELENLIYSRIRCNLYKSDFWSEDANAPQLWNLRNDPAEMHFWLADDGRLFSLTDTGEFTIRKLKLDRPQLIEYRRYQILSSEERQLLEENDITIQALLRLGEDQAEIIRRQQILLEEQSYLLNLLLKKPNP